MFLYADICIFLTLVLMIVNGSEIQEIAVDQGQNLTLPCLINGNGEDIMWIREGREERQNERLTVQFDGTLFLNNVNKNDSGIYSCSLDSPESDNTTSKVKVQVRTPPPPLENVTIHPSTILALILWEVKDNGGYPILDFTAEYKLATAEEWIPITPNHISPNSRQIDVYKLEPNTTYAFRIWATNQLGQGDITVVESKTLKVYEEIELARHFLAGTENFDTRVWVVAVGIVMGTLTVLGLGTCYLLYLECRAPGGK